jgi:hypothetical protein
MSQAVGPRFYDKFSSTLQINPRGSKVAYFNSRNSCSPGSSTLLTTDPLPLLAIAKMGPSAYKDPATLQGRIASHPFYGWKTGAEYAVTKVYTRIIIVGVDTASDPHSVYYVVAKEKQERQLDNYTEKHYWTPLNGTIYCVAREVFLLAAVEIRTPGTEKIAAIRTLTPFMKRWIFCEKDQRSYSGKDLIAHALQEYRSQLADLQEGQSAFAVYCYTPLKTHIGHIDIATNAEGFFPTEKEFVERVEKCLPQTVDWAATSGQTDCVLTMQPYEQPYRLALNGKTYSKQAFDVLVASVVNNAKPTTLDDGTLIRPADISNLTLHPNLSFWDEVDIPEEAMHRYEGDKFSVAPFDYRKALRNNIPDLFSLMNHEISGDGRSWNAQPLYQKYTKARGMAAEEKPNPVMLEDLVVSGTTFYVYHRKQPSLQLKNMLFEDCQITGYPDGKQQGCACCLRISSSRFRNCTIDLQNIERSPLMEATVFEDCTFLTDSPLHIIRLVNGLHCLIRCIMKTKDGRTIPL